MTFAAARRLEIKHSCKQFDYTFYIFRLHIFRFTQKPKQLRKNLCIYNGFLDLAILSEAVSIGVTLRGRMGATAPVA